MTIQYHISITVSSNFVNIPQHSVGHQNPCVVIDEQRPLQTQNDKENNTVKTTDTNTGRTKCHFAQYESKFIARYTKKATV